MYVEDVEDGVCGFYTTLHTEYFTHLTHVEDVKDAKCYCTLCTGSLAPPGGKASNVPFTLWV